MTDNDDKTPPEDPSQDDPKPIPAEPDGFDHSNDSTSGSSGRADPEPTDDEKLSSNDIAATIDTSRGGDDSELVAKINEAIAERPVKHAKLIGNYRIERVIGEGGMGTTYEAVQATPRRRVAVKVVRASRFSEQALRRFEYEGQMLARLQHPGIAQIYEAGMWTDEEGNERPFMAMEFVEGCSLSEYVKRNDLGSDACLRLFQKICEAVHYSHQRGVIHRDLKPDNILIRKDGQPKVIDFGVARATDSDLNFVTQQTNMGQLIGTLQYMSPEQVEYDTTDLDTRSDVYALGVILYEMLCGALPYDLKERALHEAVRVICEDQPEHPSTFHRYLRGDVETITLKALEKNRNRRYGSAEDLSSDIRRYLENDPIEARPPSLGYRLSKFSRKHKGAAISAAALAIAITVGGVVSAMGWSEASRQRAQVEVRNAQLDDSITSMLTGVMGQIKYLGNSAIAQRKLLDLAGKNLDVIASGDVDDARRHTLLGQVLLRIARSHLSMSGVGSGSLDAAAAALTTADEHLNAIEVDKIDDANLAGAARNTKLSLLKTQAEVTWARAREAASIVAQHDALQQAAEAYRVQLDAGRAHEQKDEAKGIDVQMSAQQSLGNVLMELNDTQGARKAYAAALVHATRLTEIDGEGGRRPRRMRDKAVALHGLAQVNAHSAPQDANVAIDEAIELARAVMAIEPTNVRRPRDLAIMLALRGQIRVHNDLNPSTGVEDYRECVDLLTTRAVESPRETASQQDLQNTLIEMANVLHQANRLGIANELIGTTISQLHCVAEAEDRAGNPVWVEILTRLKDHTNTLAEKGA